MPKQLTVGELLEQLRECEANLLVYLAGDIEAAPLVEVTVETDPYDTTGVLQTRLCVVLSTGP